MTALEVRSGGLCNRPVSWDSNAEVSAPVGTPDARPVEEAELVARLRSGNTNHLAILFDRYSRLVLGTAFRVLGDPSEAEEIVQDVFFYLYRRPELFDPSKGTLKAWIVQITVCRALDRKAHLARRRIFPADLEALKLAEQRDLETEVEAKFSRKHIEAALAGLPQMQRLTIEFFYFDGLNFKEISSRLSQPLGNVRHHFYRGLKRLRRNDVLHRLRCK
jgi:RNA polymerase sigma-70 factor (ECF subfamily)